MPIGQTAGGTVPPRATRAVAVVLIAIAVVVTVPALAVPAVVVWDLASGVPAERISPPGLLASDLGTGLLPPSALLLGVFLCRRLRWAGLARTALTCVLVLAADLAVLGYDLVTLLAGQP